MNVSSSITDFFQGNPFNNPVGSCIEKATDSKHEAENWSLIMDACDIINSMQDGPKLAIRAIKRRFSTDCAKNIVSIIYTLTLLETCVKNCGKRFQLVVCNRDFLQDLERVVLSSSSSKQMKPEIPIVVRDRILLLIQTWFDSFKGQQDFQDIEVCYGYLRGCGVQFPMTNLTTMSPINTPKRSVVAPKQDSQEGATISRSNATNEENKTHQQSNTVDITDKLLKNLLIVQGNINVMSELMCENPLSDFVPDDVVSLMRNLENICRQMQTRLVELINRWDEIEQKDSPVLLDLLRVNDDLNTVLIKYEAYEKSRLEQIILSEEELKNRMTKSHISDVYAAQQEATNFIDGLSKLKSSESKVDKNGVKEGEASAFQNRNVRAGISSTAAPFKDDSGHQSLQHLECDLSINGESPKLTSRQDPLRTFASRPREKEIFDL